LQKKNSAFIVYSDKEQKSVCALRISSLEGESMKFSQKPSLIKIIRNTVYPLSNNPKSYYPLLDRIADAHFVLLGEATHGTSQFYTARAQITSLLIKEKGFNVIAVEADFPEVQQINQFLKGNQLSKSATESLEGFKRFPVWMWKNKEMLSFIEQLKEINLQRSSEKKIAFYGLDLYSMYSSIEAVISYLDKVDPVAAQMARKRYDCFYRYGSDDDSYGQAMNYVKENCQKQVVDQLLELQKKRNEYLQKNNLQGSEELFYAEQNARVAKDAEQYYREMFNRRVKTWNLRDLHMADMVEEVSSHVKKISGASKIVVWAHNSHVGNALATEFSESEELSLGQLVLFRHWGDSYLVGFTTYEGTVAAASHWGAKVEKKTLNPALDDSYEELFHNTDIKTFMLDFNDLTSDLDTFKKDHLERSVGVVYNPESERVSHYFNARMADQFHAVIHIDHTSAVEPLL
jgi:erythromycin esterase-like protein